MRTIVEKGDRNLVVLDVLSKLVQERIIFIDDVITDNLANEIIAQLLYLDSVNKGKMINIYINTPGGSMYDGNAILDIMEKIESPIRTVGVGMVASIGIPIFLAGEKRAATKRCRFMIHQPSGGVRGQASDIEITHKEIIYLRDEMYNYIAERTGNSYDKVKVDCDRDYWMSSVQAKNYGIVTELI